MPTVQSAGVPIFYEVIGTGTPILLVHGFLSSFEGNWGQSGWTDFLVAQGRQVVGMDCRGHGRSGKPHDPRAYEGHQVADGVLAVMDAVGLDRVDIMGYSMGGRIAIDLLARFPERFSAVIAGGAGLRTALPDPSSLAAGGAALETDDVSTITNPAAHFMRQVAEGGPTDPTSNDLKALGAAYRSSGWYDPVDEASLHRVQAPVLVVIGEKDQGLALAQRLVETVSHGELVVLAGEDHASAARAQNYKDAVASFLKMHSFSVT
jgi:pimeloyl-ACP methyl ester carboxylesterase